MDQPTRDNHRKMKLQRRVVLLALICFSLTACIAPTILSLVVYNQTKPPDSFIMTATAFTLTNIQISTHVRETSDARTQVAAGATSVPAATCVITRAFGFDEEAAQTMLAALEQGGITGAIVRISFDGEDAMCDENGVKTTDVLIRYISPEITVPLPDDDTPEARGALIQAILNAIEPVEFRYPQTLTIIFQGADGTTDRWMRDYVAAYDALRAGTAPADLYASGK